MDLAAPGRVLRVVGPLVTSTALVTMAGLFALAHWQHWYLTGDPKGICFALQEVTVVIVALGRRRPFEVSRRPLDWVCAALGSYSLLLLRPTGTSPSALTTTGTVLQIAGALCAAACIFHLGRSFGVVPANRGIKSTGMYKVVRHPLYAAYAVATTGYLLAAPTAWNCAVVLTAMAFQGRRMFAEEAVLATSAEYRAYSGKVRWRLIPRVI
jgi:protein-S-isoprenylcysteine O-methyltransferase Ste14